MDTKILKETGLSDNEVKLYLELLKLGETSTGPLIKNTGIASSRVYTSLSSLVNRGLVTFITKNNTKYYKAENPDTLLKNVEEKKKQLEEILPNLKSIMKKEEKETYSTIFEGFNGFKTAFQNQIDECIAKDEIFVIGFSPQNYAFKSLRTFLKNIDLKRHKKKVKLKIILPKESKNTIGKDREKEPYTNVRYMSGGFFSPTAMNIYKDYVLLTIWEEKPTVFLIKNDKIATSFKQYFNSLWNIAKK
ncbi:MAG: helix-turn-helix domain-containing protein [Nanoarchaeota archaeon]